MPDILIRGMEMPRNCFQCPLFSNCDACEGHECGCGLLGGIGYEEDISEDRRRDDCPIHELPPHGDLIDRDAILKAERNKPISKMMMFGGAYVYDESVINDAPVVVPAERSDTDA